MLTFAPERYTAGLCMLTIVRLMTSISKGENTPIVLKDKITIKSNLINYAMFFRLSSLPKSVGSYCTSSPKGNDRSPENKHF